MLCKETKLINTLKELKEKYGVTYIKTSFETENLGSYELTKIKNIASKAEVELLVKLGGCEALTDIKIAQSLDAKIILGPMIEIKFALEKFLDMCQNIYGNEKNTKFFINIEIIESCENIEKILKAKNIEKLDGVVVGRTDLCKSLEGKYPVNSLEVLEIIKKLFKVLKAKNINCYIGGGISLSSIDFIENLNEYLSGFETRKIVFEKFEESRKDLKAGIKLALEAELLWYEIKKEYYKKRFEEDDKKIIEMERALEL